VKRQLEWIEIPGEHEARERAWRVVSAAFAEREPAPRARSWRPLAVAAAALAVGAAALSAPGKAVLGDVRDAVLPARVERMQPALFALPAPGRLLVVSAEQGGVWVVRSDGSRRRLGDYEDARWSPFGRFIVATKPNGLYALTPEGEERWSLARRGVHAPSWGGTRRDTRVAYLARSGLRVVDGDGENDRLLAPAEAGPSAWRPRVPNELAYLSASELRLQDVDTGRVLWRATAGSPFAPLALSWSADGQRVAAVFEGEVLVFDGRGRIVRRLPFLGSRVVAASFAPAGHVLGVLLRAPGVVGDRTRTSLRSVDVDRTSSSKHLFTGRGDFGELAWSPDGRFILVAWRSANRWLFVNRSTRYAIAVDRVESQFPRPDGRRPLLLVSDRWSRVP
jgi:WD40-like Beta Propeller Repeat